MRKCGFYSNHTVRAEEESGHGHGHFFFFLCFSKQDTSAINTFSMLLYITTVSCGVHFQKLLNLLDKAKTQCFLSFTNSSTSPISLCKGSNLKHKIVKGTQSCRWALSPFADSWVAQWDDQRLGPFKNDLDLSLAYRDNLWAKPSPSFHLGLQGRWWHIAMCL